MTVILGISGYYHDSAAAILVDGKIVDRWGPLFDPTEVLHELDQVAR